MGVEEAIKALFAEGEEPPTRIPYRSAWAMAARNTGRPVGGDEYAAAVGALVTQEYLRRRSIGATTPLVRRAERPGSTRERDLMPGVREWLELVWLANYSAPTDMEIVDRKVIDTSQALVHGHKVNPDFIALFRCRKRTKLRALSVVAVAFELKPADAPIGAALTQTSHYRNFLNQAYLIWHVDGDHIKDDGAEDLKRECEIRSLGFVSFSEAQGHESYQVLREADRTEPDEQVKEDFIGRRVPPEVFERFFAPDNGNEQDGSDEHVDKHDA